MVSRSQLLRNRGEGQVLLTKFTPQKKSRRHYPGTPRVSSFVSSCHFQIIEDFNSSPVSSVAVGGVGTSVRVLILVGILNSRCDWWPSTSSSLVLKALSVAGATLLVHTLTDKEHYLIHIVWNHPEAFKELHHIKELPVQSWAVDFWDIYETAVDFLLQLNSGETTEHRWSPLSYCWQQSTGSERGKGKCTWPWRRRHPSETSY